MTTTGTRIQVRRDTSTNWASANPVLAAGEPGEETDTGSFKFGDGSTAWNSLGYAQAIFVRGSAGANLLSSKLTGETIPRLQITQDGLVYSGDLPVPISNVTGTTTITVTTSSTHSLAIGDKPTFAGVGGVTGVNGNAWTVASVADSTHFTATGGTAAGAYTTGGTVQRQWGTMGVTNEGLWNFIQTANKPLLSFRGMRGGTGNLFIISDYTNSPIFAIPVAGGPGVFGDNFRVFKGGDVFNPVIKLCGATTSPGSISMAQGDPTGGAGVLAMGNATVAPSAQPDGTHTLDGSTTVAGLNLFSVGGRLYIQDGSGSIGEVGLHTKRRQATVQKDIGTTTLSASGIPAPTLSPGSGGAAASSADNVLSGQAIVTVGTSATNGNAAKLSPASFTQTYMAWAPMAWFRIGTDTSIANSRWWVGLFSADPSGTSTPTSACGFRYDTGVDGTAFWRTYTQDGTTATVTTTTSSIAVSSFYDMRVEVAYNNASVRFLINDVVVATHTTHLPAYNTAMAPSVTLTTLTASQVKLGFGRLVLTQVG